MSGVHSNHHSSSPVPRSCSPSRIVSPAANYCATLTTAPQIYCCTLSKLSIKGNNSIFSDENSPLFQEGQRRETDSERAQPVRNVSMFRCCFGSVPWVGRFVSPFVLSGSDTSISWWDFNVASVPFARLQDHFYKGSLNDSRRFAKY